MASSRFCYFNCSLCLQPVDQNQPDSYDAFYKPENIYHIKQYFPSRGSKVIAGDLKAMRGYTYPDLPYTDRLWVLHHRCRELVSHLSPGMLGSLMDLVDPTFLQLSQAPPSSWSLKGLFYSASPQLPVNTGPSIPDQCKTIPSSSWSSRFPPEIWDMIQQYALWRLGFIMHTAIQLEGSGLQPACIPMDRFIIRTLTLTSGMLRIDIATIGGRTYISRLSDPQPPVYYPGSDSELMMVPWQAPDFATKLMKRIKARLRISYKLFALTDLNYLALKSDGMGIVDIALRRVNSKPDWILNATTRPFIAEISEIHHANLRSLTVISDSLKCRAIIPANRAGAEPFFYKPPFPPADAYVDSGFPIEWKEYSGEKYITYIAKAKYIPFAGVTTFTLEFRTCKNMCPHAEQCRNKCSTKVLSGIRASKNIEEPRRPTDRSIIYQTIELPRPPETIKISFDNNVPYHNKERHRFIQFNVNGIWQPPIPKWPPLHETVVDNVLGIWWANTASHLPPHFGVVVSKKESLQNTLIDEIDD